MHGELALEYITRKRAKNYNHWTMNGNLLDMNLKVRWDNLSKKLKSCIKLDENMSFSLLVMANYLKVA